jgi:hypothetical protein
MQEKMEQPLRLIAAAIASLLASSAAARADCSSDVAEAFQKLRMSKGFRMETSIVNEQGKLKMKVDYNPPDKMYQRVRLDESPADMEMIVIGGKAWSNQGQGWVELPENFATAVAGQVQATLIGLDKGATSYTCLGDQDLDGRKVAAYRASLPMAEQTVQGGKPVKTDGPPNVQTVYVDVATKMPARNVVVDGTDSSKTLFDGWFKVGDDIVVAPPLIQPDKKQ